MSNIKIAIYSGKDKQEVADLILGIQTNEFNIRISLDEQPDLKNIPGFYQVNKGNFWIATVDDKLAGTIGLLDIGNQNGALRKMFVDAEYRGKEYGIGQRLLNTLITWAEINDFKKIFLGTTEKFIAAHRFYEKNNFIEIEKKLLPGEFPVMEVDVKFYRYIINA